MATDLEDLAARYTRAIATEIDHVNAMATTMAEAIGELGEPHAVESVRSTLGALDRDRVEHIATVALLILAQAKTGAQLRGRMRRA